MNTLRANVMLTAALLLTAVSGQAGEAGEAKPPGFIARLIRDMADPLELARLPQNLEFTYQVASSVNPNGGAGLLSTLDHYVSQDENGQAVLADLTGPGCVRRMYFAGAPQPGSSPLLDRPRRIAFYFDGEAEPRLETTLQKLAEDLIDWKGIGEWPHKPAGPLAGHGGGGYYGYLPLPYKKSLKIVFDAQDLRGFAYQIGYHRYAAEPAGMTSFDKSALKSALSDPYVKLVARVMDPEVTPVTGMRLRGRELPVASLKPGQSIETKLEGPGIVRELDLRWARADGDAQRGLVLRCYWDGSEQASIELPVDDLFGFDHGHKARVAMYLLDRQDGVGGERRGRLWIPMPFRSAAVIRIVNEGDSAVPVGLGVRHERLRELDPDFGYLHAQWRRAPRADEGAEVEASAAAADYQLVDIAGHGRFVGCLLSVNKLRSGRDYLQFGETLQVDGRIVRGSAMDHFFNGYDKYRRRFDAAYHAVPIQRGGNLTQFRFFIPDSIPFHQHLALSFPNPDREDFSSIAFWYQRQIHPAFAALQPAADRARFHRSFKVPGCIEAEDIQMERSTRYISATQLAMEDFDEYSWSNDRQLYVSTGVAHPDSWFELKLPVNLAGRYRVQLYMTKGNGYTDIIPFVNGAKCTLTDEQGQVHERFSGAADSMQPVGPLSLGIHELKQGANLLKFQHASPGRRFVAGVDCIVLVPEVSK